MKINTKRLELVPHGFRFLESTVAYSNNIENTRYMTVLPNESVQEAVDFLHSVDREWEKPQPRFFEFALLLDGKHIGAVSISLDESRTVGELGWIVHRDHWGCGYAFEAAEAVIAQFKNKGVTRFLAHCDSENAASFRVMEKLGMQRISCTGGRKNRSSNEERLEYCYELTIH